MITATFNINQGRKTTYGCEAKMWEETFKCYVKSYAHAKRIRNTIIVSELAYKGLIDYNGVELSGKWRIVRQEGKTLICEKD